MVALLDVNILIALAWPIHVHYTAAHRWLASRRASGWATCLLTQSAFVRLSAQPAVVGVTISVADALLILERNLRSADHQFWPMTRAVTDIDPAIRSRIMGPGQLNDALLLDLARSRQGVLATFDRRIQALVPSSAEYQSALEIIPVD
jgi:uncharacterized protein